MVSRVEGVAPINPEAVELLFVLFGVFNDGDQFVGLAGAAAAGPKALLLFFQDIILFKELSHAVVDHRGDQLVDCADTAYWSLIGQVGGWGFFEQEFNHSYLPVCREHSPEQDFID